MARRNTTAPELQLIPIMNLVTLLIPFLLMSAQFVAYAVIDTSLPAICQADCGQASEEGVQVELTLQGSGYLLRATGPGLQDYAEGLAIPCIEAACSGLAHDAWDVDALRVELTRIKDRHPDETRILIAAEDGVAYDALVLAMDATREDPGQGGMPGEHCTGRCLYPDVTLAARTTK